MKRTKKEEDTRPLFIKRGGGSFRIDGRIIKPNQKFRAHVFEIPVAFRDSVIPVEGSWDEVVEQEAEKITTPDEVLFKLKRRGTTKYYDVVNSEGKAQNEERLDKETAEELVQALNAK